MDDKQRLQLSNMIKANNVEDQTGLIRNLKHSQVLRNEINNINIGLLIDLIKYTEQKSQK